MNPISSLFPVLSSVYASDDKKTVLLAQAAPPKKADAPRATGNVNIVPDPNGIFVGAFVGDMITESSVAEFERASGQKLDIGLKFMAFAAGLNFPENEASVMAKRNGVIFIKLEPWSWKGANDRSFMLRNVTSGKYDDLLVRFADGAARTNLPFLVSFGHEMNGNWYPWAGSPDEFKAAYRHVHDVIEARAPKATWVYNPNVDFGMIGDYYPGNAYVDWVGPDGYSGPQNGGCKDFSSIFEGTLEDLRAAAPTKPILIGEFAADATECGQPDFLRNAVSYMAQNKNRIKGFIYFNINKESKWKISSTPSQSAWSKALAAVSSLFVKSPLEVLGLKWTAPQQAERPSEAPATMPTNAIMVTANGSGWNGGSIQHAGDTYTFKSSGATDAGFTIGLGGLDVSSKKVLKFEIMGTVKKDADWTRFRIELYEPGDNTPDRANDGLDVPAKFETITLPLDGLKKVLKFQGLLVGSGSCQIQIKNLRFE